MSEKKHRQRLRVIPTMVNCPHAFLHQLTNFGRNKLKLTDREVFRLLRSSWCPAHFWWRRRCFDRDSGSRRLYPAIQPYPMRSSRLFGDQKEFKESEIGIICFGGNLRWWHQGYQLFDRGKSRVTLWGRGAIVKNHIPLTDAASLSLKTIPWLTWPSNRSWWLEIKN